MFKNPGLSRLYNIFAISAAVVLLEPFKSGNQVLT